MNIYKISNPGKLILIEIKYKSFLQLWKKAF